MSVPVTGTLEDAAGFAAGRVVYWAARTDLPGPFGPRETRAALLSEMWSALGRSDLPDVTRGPYGGPHLAGSDWRVSFAGVRVPAGTGPDVSLVALCQGAAVGIDAERAGQPGPGVSLPTFVLQEALLKALGTGFLVDPAALRDVPDLPVSVLGCGLAWYRTVPLAWYLSGVLLAGRSCHVAWAVRDACTFELVRLC